MRCDVIRLAIIYHSKSLLRAARWRRKGYPQLAAMNMEAAAWHRKFIQQELTHRHLIRDISRLKA